MRRPARAGLLARLARAVRPRSSSPAVASSPRRKPYLRIAGLYLLTALVAGTLLAWWILGLLTGSLPTLEGRVKVEGISAEVRIERDDRGIPTLRAANRLDLAFATGYVHGQDRFFQMDFLRRHPAGELSELAGKAALSEDRHQRRHRFRFRAHEKLKQMAPEERLLLERYSAGVEAGRRSLRRPPFEYILLQTAPQPWLPEDTLLVVLGMFTLLQSTCTEHEKTHGVILEKLPAPLAAFLMPGGTPWDAALDGSTIPAPPIPGPEVLDLRKRPPAWEPLPPLHLPPIPEGVPPGSNNWAVAGKRTVHGGAIVANDMHLMLMAPGLWYRAAFHWNGPDGQQHRAVGITLPGTPALVVGSTTKIAWGFTNTEGDWADLVILETDPANPKRYRTPKGWTEFDRVEEVIKVRGSPDVIFPIEETIWGPVIEARLAKGKRALRWVAHDVEALDLGLMKLETARTVEEAIDVARRAGLPAENFVVGDSKGNIGWTIIGRIPRRVGFDGTRPMSWADGKCKWDGWLRPDEHPTIINPADGILWTANNRTIGKPATALIGLHCYDAGARAKQIRDGLLAKDKLTEADMLAIQLDDRALFMERWREVLLAALSAGEDEERALMRREVIYWRGRAVPESIGFRLVKDYRHRVREKVLGALTVPCRKADRSFNVGYLDVNVEESVYQLVTKKPAHLLPARYRDWDHLLLECVEQLQHDIRGKEPPFAKALARFTWANGNKVRVRHPLSEAVGPLARWLDLDMPREPLPGDWSHMPRVQTPGDGASQRMAVSPGREAEGYFHMPAGQSGHPLSPHYRDGHAAWAHGLPTPFLPGEKAEVLVLVP